MLTPARTKYRKIHRGRRKGKAYRGFKVAFGQYGLKATTPGWVTSRQIEAARVAIIRNVRKHGKLWIRIFPDHPVTKKPAETRMGKGKGAPEYFVAVVKPGRVMFEVEGIPEEAARQALALGAHKLPVGTKFVKRLEA